MKKSVLRKLGVISAAMMGVNLAACGIMWNQWQYWVLFGTAFLWAAVAWWEGLEAGKR